MEKIIEKTSLGGFHEWYKFAVGEKACIMPGRYYKSYNTRLWMRGYECEIIKYNECTVTVRILDFPDERWRIDYKDLVPIGYNMSCLA